MRILWLAVEIQVCIIPRKSAKSFARLFFYLKTFESTGNFNAQAQIIDTFVRHSAFIDSEEGASSQRGLFLRPRWLPPAADTPSYRLPVTPSVLRAGFYLNANPVLGVLSDSFNLKGSPLQIGTTGI